MLDKACHKPTISDYTLITHWQCSIEEQFTSLYPLASINTSPCYNCPLNSNTIANRCTIFIPTSHATKFFGRVNSDKSINLNANHLDLIYSIAYRSPIHLLSLPNIVISPALIPSIFQSGTALDTLQSIANQNCNLTELIFYTDGSVLNFSSSQCSMGIGWIQLQNTSIIHIFQAQIKFWPCFFKAELIAILFAICTAPRNCNIQVFTDSQSVISKYNNLINTILPSKSSNIPYWTIWNTLLNFAKLYNLNIKFHKVIAYQNDEFNNKADQLAHSHQIAPYLIFNPHNIYNPSIYLS